MQRKLTTLDKENLFAHTRVTKGRKIYFQINTGAAVNVIPKQVLRK